MPLECFPLLRDNTRLIRHKDDLYKVKVRYDATSFAGKKVPFSATDAHNEIEQTFRAVVYMSERDIQLKPIQTPHFIITPQKISWSFTRKHPSIHFLQNGKKLHVVPYVFDLFVKQRSDLRAHSLASSGRTRSVERDKAYDGNRTKERHERTVETVEGDAGKGSRFMRSKDGRLYMLGVNEAAVIVKRDEASVTKEMSNLEPLPEQRMPPAKRKSSENIDSKTVAREQVLSKLQKISATDQTSQKQGISTSPNDEGEEVAISEDENRHHSRMRTREIKSRQESSSDSGDKGRDSANKGRSSSKRDDHTAQQDSRHPFVSPRLASLRHEVPNKSSTYVESETDNPDTTSADSDNTQSESNSTNSKDESEKQQSRKKSLRKLGQKETLKPHRIKERHRSKLQHENPVHEGLRRSVRNKSITYTVSEYTKNDSVTTNKKTADPVIKRNKSKERNVTNSSLQQLQSQRTDKNRNMSVSKDSDDGVERRKEVRRSQRIADLDTSNTDSQESELPEEEGSQLSQDIPSSQESGRSKHRLYKVTHSPLVRLPLNKDRFAGSSPQVSTVRPVKRDSTGRVVASSSPTRRRHPDSAVAAHQAETSRLSWLRSGETTGAGRGERAVSTPGSTQREVLLTQSRDRYTVEQAERDEVAKLRQLYEPTGLRRSPRIAQHQGDTSDDSDTGSGRQVIRSRNQAPVATRRRSSGLWGRMMDTLLFRNR